MNFQKYLNQLQNGKNLEQSDAEIFLSYMLDNESLSDQQLKDALVALTQKGPTTEEICGFVAAMKQRMITIEAPDNAIDTCGTGGDKSGTFNISTAAAILLAAGNVPVAKHGNRAATSRCGSADVLAELGIPIHLTPEEASKSLHDYRFTFLFAPQYHPALKRLALIRKQLTFPTVFNLLGPLLNPASVKRQVIGTYNKANSELLTQVVKKMDVTHVVILYSDDGLDEAGLNVPVNITEIKHDEIKQFTIQATDVNLEAAPLSALVGGDAIVNARMIKEALMPTGTINPPQSVILLNSGIGFYVSGKVSTIADGVKQATAVLSSGKAQQKLEQLREP